MLIQYLHRLYDTVVSRGYIEIEHLFYDEMPGQQGIVEGRLAFHDGSLLEFHEFVVVRNGQLVKLRYAYHYQNKSLETIFRYDNAPHYPHMATYPHHKHVGFKVEPSEVPSLNQVIREIEQLIFDN